MNEREILRGNAALVANAFNQLSGANLEDDEQRRPFSASRPGEFTVPLRRGVDVLRMDVNNKLVCQTFAGSKLRITQADLQAALMAI